jgi:peptidoglycan/xylan/chitin deacetylase (PgdA/CDA1 family)
MQLLAINFHYFREQKPKSGIYPLTTKEFEKQIEIIAKTYDFISENEIMDSISNRNNRNKKRCLLTFDDGLKEQMKIAELLERKGIPGMFYVSTNPIRNNTVLDVHKLHFIRSKIKDEKLFNLLFEEFNLDNYKFNDNLLKNQYRYDNLISSKIKYFLNFVLSDKEKKEVIDKLFVKLAGSEKEFSKNLYMDNKDLKWLFKKSMLGTHGDKHIPLACLSSNEIEKDINMSIKYLESIVGDNSINSISYPYGGKKAVSNSVATIAEKCGLSFGLTMNRGVNYFDKNQNNFLLNRIDTNDAPGGKLENNNFI